MLQTEEFNVKNIKIIAKELISKVYFTNELQLSIEAQSKLIEQLLLGISTEKALFLEDTNGDLEIVKADSFYAFTNFLNGEFRLNKLNYLKHLNNLDFKTIIKSLHTNIDQLTVDCIIISPKQNFFKLF